MVGTDGVMTLRANHEALVGVSAQTSCSPVLGDSVQLAANLKAPFRGVDLGSNTGLQFEQAAGAVQAVIKAKPALLEEHVTTHFAAE